MRTQIVIFQCNHYDMDSQKGVSVRVLGSKEETNNKFGTPVNEAKVMNYHELEYLKQHKDKLPAKFEADLHMITVKNNNGKETAGIGLTELRFINPVELVDVGIKVPAKA